MTLMTYQGHAQSQTELLVDERPSRPIYSWFIVPVECDIEKLIKGHDPKIYKCWSLEAGR